MGTIFSPVHCYVIFLIKWFHVLIKWLNQCTGEKSTICFKVRDCGEDGERISYFSEQLNDLFDLLYTWYKIQCICTPDMNNGTRLYHTLCIKTRYHTLYFAFLEHFCTFFRITSDLILFSLHITLPKSVSHPIWTLDQYQPSGLWPSGLYLRPGCDTDFTMHYILYTCISYAHVSWQLVYGLWSNW